VSVTEIRSVILSRGLIYVKLPKFYPSVQTVMPSLENTVDLLQLFGETTRVRLLALLGAEALSLADLSTILEMPRARVAEQLARLREAGLVVEQVTTVPTHYELAGFSGQTKALWDLVQKETSDSELATDERRLKEFRRSRRRAQKWPDTVAGEMERHYSPGRTWESTARGLVGLLRLGDTLDIGCGDGAIGQVVVAQARSLTCLDSSERMIEAAKLRFKGYDNVSFAVGDMHALRFADDSFDEIMIFSVLAYSVRPDLVLAEACRVLRPGGRVAIMCLHAHQHAEIAARYDHVNLGFSQPEVTRLHQAAGLSLLSLSVCIRERRKPYFEVLSAVSTKS
jgi:ArsR family transcriptional regulator